MLGLMAGDALGAAFEGFPQEEIRSIARRTWGGDLVEGFISAVPMGTFVPDKEPGTYRPAVNVRDVNYVPAGPPSNDNVAKHCARRGMYTDDTNACLALASSILACGRADAEHAARSSAELCWKNEAFRGFPPTAKRVMQAVLNGTPAEEAGLPPHFPFEGGSFANGGAMRISPLGIAYRNCDALALRRAVETATRASHRHPEAVDFAVVQAAAVQYALRTEPPDFDAAALLADLAGRCETDAMRDVVSATSAALQGFEPGGSDWSAVDSLVGRAERPGSGMGFQIASVHMAPCVLWPACRHHRDPRRAVQAAIDLGGDTDTTASMVGAIVGALHGLGWCADWASELENGEHGRDYALGLAEKLAHLDILE
mmetsp:Transcript_117965/g.334536  ORF Transcript_117965/g.334536 Transcript_117965/m.334536 type:complete len:371 (+) Transcript_117965:3-1115(+)